MKRKLFKTGSFLLPVLLTVFLTSCLNDAEHEKDFSNLGAVVEFLRPDGPLFVSVPLNASDKSAVSVNYKASDEFKIAFNIAAPYPLGQDVDVTWAVDPTILTKYNESGKAADPDNWVDQLLMPATFYTLPSTTTKIPAGIRSVPLSITVPSIDYYADPDYASYVLPLRITSATNNVIVSGNLGIILLRINVKNDYEATYHSVGTFTRLGVTRDIDRDKYFSTVDSNTIDGEFADLGSVIRIKINSDNTLTLTPITAHPTTIAVNTKPGDNTYNPATKTFILHYSYLGGTREGFETVVRK
jgi:Domain of unknown function (DUF1735)/Domain of unknown function (DUF4361)